MRISCRPCRPSRCALAVGLADRHKKAPDSFLSGAIIMELLQLQLGTCCDQSLALVVAGVLDKVLLETSCQILCLCVPFGSVSVGVSGIQNVGVNAGQSGGNFEVEVGDGLGLSLQDGAIQNSVDDAAGILNGDTLAGAVPAGVDQVSLCAGLLHLLDQLFAVLGGVQLQESSAEASGEGGGGLSDATLGTGQLGGEAGEEVVLSLLGGQDGNGRQNAECVSGQEDDVLCVGACGHGANNVVDVVDGVGNTGVLGDGAVSEVALAVFVNSDVLQQSVAADSVVDIGFGILIEVDNLSVAAAFEVEHTVVIPAVFVITDEETFRIC